MHAALHLLLRQDDFFFVFELRAKNSHLLVNITELDVPFGVKRMLLEIHVLEVRVHVEA